MKWWGIRSCSNVWIQDAVQGGLSQRIDQLSEFIANGEKLLVVLTTFIVTGVGGIALAWSKVRQQIKGVEDKVEPVKREVTQAGDPDSHTLSTQTLREKVEEILVDINADKGVRGIQHAMNTSNLRDNTDQIKEVNERLGAVETTISEVKANVKGVGDEVKEIRSMVQKVLAKMAGV